MNKEELAVYANVTLEHCKRIMHSKGAEYESTGNVFATFNKIAKDLDISPEVVCLVYLKKHLQAIENTVRSNSHSIEEETRIQDCINYLLIIGGMRSMR